MPNWCGNKVVIDGHKRWGKQACDKIEASIKPFKGDKENIEWDFRDFVPLQKKGKPIDWNYNLAIQEWGCKWTPRVNSHERTDDRQLVITFDTPWSPPLEFLKKVCEQLPVTINIEYEEPGMQFKGEAEYKHIGKGGVEIVKEEQWGTNDEDEV